MILHGNVWSFLDLRRTINGDVWRREISNQSEYILNIRHNLRRRAILGDIGSQEGPRSFPTLLQSLLVDQL